ncbi:hypothetical protein L1987_10108 [Smallanthus sonchifolius]|uniref:Uncharacterized protein n=1 Tax=Smallanthus sonchifolius TaxID=185202 RepID=A0ACB9JR72_9ASTR|nr:hypothetical protein L1987_10108 [Smallanthus sonchifolius]
MTCGWWSFGGDLTNTKSYGRETNFPAGFVFFLLHKPLLIGVGSSLSETTDKRLSVSGSCLHPLKYNQAYAVVKNSFVSPEDVLAQQIVVQKSSPRGVHFRRARPREKPEEDRGINQVYKIGGDSTQKGAVAIYKEVEKCRLSVVVAGIPKTIDNDIAASSLNPFCIL